SKWRKRALFSNEAKCLSSEVVDLRREKAFYLEAIKDYGVLALIIPDSCACFGILEFWFQLVPSIWACLGDLEFFSY
ncbi:hypothetical protein HAX54_011178, partial [Datura stramonium]|nr:hypothetical protein [Datura stramonium]